MLQLRFTRLVCLPAILALAGAFWLPLAPSGHGAQPGKYAAVAEALGPWLQREVELKNIPSLSIALVDDQQIVWSGGFGFSDEQKKTHAGPDTVYRVGSVSKPVTALAMMLLVQLGLIDLDAPITTYLPEFQPTNPFGKKITLRQMLSHHSGLVRESPVGHYFDVSNPPLSAMVASLAKTELVYEPEKRISYSNAAVGTAGYVLERTQRVPFAQHMKRALLDPLGMTSSGYELTPELKKRLAHAMMWTYHGRDFEAPPIQMSMAPAGNLYSTANDMAKLMHFLFAKGKGPKGQLLEPDTIEKMYKLQFAKDGEKAGYGIGFAVSDFEGKRRINHGGAVYGFSTEFCILPDEKLGVVVMAAKDVTNGVTRHAADEALRLMMAARANKPLPQLDKTEPVGVDKARKLAGRYRFKDKTVELLQRDGKLWLLQVDGGYRVELRGQGKDLVVDDPLSFGMGVAVAGDKLTIAKTVFERAASPEPAPPADKWNGLIGEYGWDHNVLYILEMDAKLYCLIEWIALYPLKEISKDVYQFPDFGMYPGEKLVFTRDAKGRANNVNAASVDFPRRNLDGENGETFRIKPVAPLADLRKIALAAKPPVEKGEFRKPDLADVAKLDATIKLDIRYATTNNFLSTPFYTSARAFMQRPAAEALVQVHKKLAERGMGLLIFDCYRPWYVTKMFWDATPEKLHQFVADPSAGSRHNRGCAVDLTLYDLKTGAPLEMVSGYDEMSDRSYPDYLGGTALQRWRRDLLREAMEAGGFTVYEAEWWHFDFRDWRAYPIQNLTFEELEKGKQ
jgi:CubicO group peptidase (beta-lactamase class C family)/D-alanyl-D-alanine dipeptidase